MSDTPIMAPYDPPDIFFRFMNQSVAPTMWNRLPNGSLTKKLFLPEGSVSGWPITSTLLAFQYLQALSTSFTFILQAKIPRSPSLVSRSRYSGSLPLCCHTSNPPPLCRFIASTACLLRGSPPVYGSISLASASSSKMRQSIPNALMYHSHASLRS